MLRLNVAIDEEVNKIIPKTTECNRLLVEIPNAPIINSILRLDFQNNGIEISSPNNPKTGSTFLKYRTLARFAQKNLGYV